MNPPYGGAEQDSIKSNFPVDMRSSETADLFMALIMRRLKQKGRVGVVIPDGFLFGADGPKLAIKEKLLNEFTLHTVIRLPSGVFAPYASITTNLLFFDNSGPTKETWFYRVDPPSGLKTFSKTRQFIAAYLDGVREWLKDKREISENGFDKAKRYSFEELKSRDYNLDLCGYPHEGDEILSPDELIPLIAAKRAELDKTLADILAFLGPLDDQSGDMAGK
ncbi:MAG: SAM-dependent methyltransferase [Desulfovibrio sp.]|nr:SAM-dependent methyltransferase [Desulfovibrio sp.]